jgi:membrane peptidoglycan carboxypeptidase
LPRTTAIVRLRRRQRVRQKPAGHAGRNLSTFLLFLPLISLTCLGLLAGVTVAKTFNDYSTGLPNPKDLLTVGLPQTTRIYDRTGDHLLALLYTEDRDLVTYQQLPTDLVNATIATEDHTFWQNPGVDFTAIIRAFLANNTSGSLQGGSTITQQLIKNLLLKDTSTTYARKIKEAILAVRVTDTLTKEDIITLYLNDNYYGEGAYGVSAAGRRYFGLPLEQLSLAQSAMIAGLAKSPSGFDPFLDPVAAKARQQEVLAAMVKNDYLTAAQANAADAADLNLVPYVVPTAANSIAPWFVNRAIDEAATIYGGLDELQTCGCRVITTLDYDLEVAALKNVSDHLAAFAKIGNGNIHNAALLAQDPSTGELLAYVGSANYNDPSPKVMGQFDSAAMAVRSPGSTWKLITYLAAMEYGHLSPASQAWDVTTTFAPGYTPHDINNETSSGPMTIRQAIRESRNIPAIETMMANGGPDIMAAMAVRLGIKTPLLPVNLGPASAIGTNSVTLSDMTQAYSTAANEGGRIPQHTVLTIENGQGLKVYDAPTVLKATQVIDAKLTYEMLSILKDNTDPHGSSMTGYQAYLGRPAIVKTGTEDITKDTYTMGGVPQLIVGVWVGNSDNTAMPTAFHSYNGPLLIWKSFMQTAISLKKYAATDWARPAGLVAETLCANNGEYGGMGVAETVVNCPWGTSSEWVIPGFNDSAAQIARWGLQAGLLPTDGQGLLVPSTCPNAIWVTGVAAVAPDPAWQPQFDAWVASAKTGALNQGGRFAWQSYTWLRPGGVCPSFPPCPSVSPAPSESPSPTDSPNPGDTPTPEPTPTEQTCNPNLPSPGPTAAATPTPVPTPTPTASPPPTASLTPSASPPPTASPTPSASPPPTASPTPVPSASPTPSPTASPTPAPAVSASPLSLPSISPSPLPAVVSPSPI